MSNELDELRGTLCNTVCNASNYTKRAQPYLLGSDMSVVIDKTADAILAAGYRKPRTITTSEEMAMLNTGTVILSAEGGVWHAYDHLGWREPGSTVAVMDADIALPATVLHEGVSK